MFKLKRFAALLSALLLVACFTSCSSEKKDVQGSTQAGETELSTLANNEIRAKRGGLSDGSKILEAYRSNDIAFSNEAKLYGMSSETAANANYKNGAWQCFVLNIEMTNKSDTDLAVNKISVEGNGENGVWICSVSQYGEFDIEAGGKQSMPVNVLVDPNAMGGKTVEQIIDGMGITLEYTEISDSMEPSSQAVGTATVK